MEEFKIKICSEEFSTELKAKKTIVKCKNYKNYLKENKYYIFYLIHTCLSDHVKDMNFKNNTVINLVLKTNFQKLVFNNTVSVTELFNIWFNRELEIIDKRIDL